MHHVEAASSLEHLCTLTQDIIEIAQYLMARDRLGILIISDSMLTDHIRRICRDHIKRRCSETLRSIFDITDNNVNLVLQIIISHASFRHISTLRLDFKPGKMRSIRFCLQKDRDNSGTSAKVERTLARLHAGKPGQKNRIHAETEAILVLYDLVPVSMKFI